MTNSLNRRRFISATAASALFAPSILRVSRVEAAELGKMAGQLLVTGLPGGSMEAGSAKALVNHVAKGNVGGAIFLRHNVKSRKAVSEMAFAMLQANRQALMSIDQEGGAVQRLNKKMGFTAIPKARWVSGNLSADDARKLYAKAGRELRAAGFNLNLAPSLDIHDAKNPVIGKYGRSFGSDGDRIANYGAAFIDGFSSAGVACSVKHFPGHGSSRGDSHDGFVDITKTWSKDELTPFRKLAAKAPLVMGGHLFHPDFSDGKLPVTFSPKSLKKVLRNDIGYRGVVITDDLDMGAIRKSFSLKEACILALQAGNDLLLLSNSLEYDEDLPVNAIGWITEAVRDGRLSQAQVKNSYARVMNLKKAVSA